MIYQLGSKRVKRHESTFIAHNAILVGDITLEQGVGIWFNTVLRGDNDSIFVGMNTNIQESCVLHTDLNFPIRLGEGVTVGHSAVIHGCEVGDCSLIGIGAVVLNGAIIGKHCLIGANTLIPEGMVVPDGSLVIGSPGKVKRSLTHEEKSKLESSALHYVKQANLYKAELVEDNQE